MKVEIWSDIACPWCYIGKRRFEGALAEFEGRDQVEVTWRSFELDPTAPAVFETSLTELLSKKYGMSPEQAQKMQDDMTRVGADEGVEFHFEKARGGTTFDAHRVLHLAKGKGLGDVMKERLLLAYFTEGLAMSDRDVLVELAVEVGLEASEVGEALVSEAFKTAVRVGVRRGRSRPLGRAEHSPVVPGDAGSCMRSPGVSPRADIIFNLGESYGLPQRPGARGKSPQEDSISRVPMDA